MPGSTAPTLTARQRLALPGSAHDRRMTLLKWLLPTLAGLLLAAIVIWPLSSVLTDYRGVSGVALSVPSLVGPAGIQRVFEFPMDAHEIGMLYKSAAAIRSTLQAIGY